MNLRLVSGFSILVLLLGVTAYAHNSAYAVQYSKNDVRSVMENYRIAIEKARADLLSSIGKANSDAKASIQKGIPTEQINAASKSSIDKARQDYKLAIEKARSDAKFALQQIILSIGPNKQSSNQR
ncbi:MAG: hypothetical protein HY295_04750 [Thaumarchaeota archaeon]|nr:hypothetical protein [Nitrososphaerota archaeon]